MGLQDACIPLLDWGFNKSDVVYDGIPFAQGRIFRLNDHLDRYWASMAAWRLSPPVPRKTVREICHDLVAISGLRDGILYICTTRGTPPSSEIRNPAQFDSRFYAWSQRVPQIATLEQVSEGLSLIVSGIPRIPQESVKSTAKNFHWGDLIQARLEAADRGADNALLPDLDGNIAEGVGFNVFAVFDRTVQTPKSHCLHGITRKTVLEIAADLGLDAAEADIPATDLGRAAEVFITSSAGGVFPVTRIDGRPVGAGAPGATTARIREEYWRRRVSPEWSEQVDYESCPCGDEPWAQTTPE